MSVDAKHVILSGTVQGVAFRWFTQERARELGVNGWVRNVYDGRVEVHCEAETQVLNDFVSWLKRGPSAARVTNIEVTETENECLATFEIRSTVSF